jgi:hypothetical protein
VQVELRAAAQQEGSDEQPALLRWQVQRELGSRLGLLGPLEPLG